MVYSEGINENNYELPPRLAFLCKEGDLRIAAILDEEEFAEGFHGDVNTSMMPLKECTRLSVPQTVLDKLAWCEALGVSINDLYLYRSTKDFQSPLFDTSEWNIEEQIDYLLHRGDSVSFTKKRILAILKDKENKKLIIAVVGEWTI